MVDQDLPITMLLSPADIERIPPENMIGIDHPDGSDGDA